MNEQLLGGVAGARARGLGVDGDRFGHREVGGGVHVDEAHALKMFDDGNGGVLRDEADEALAAARDDAMDERVEFEQRVEGGAVGRGNQLDGVGGETGGGERGGDEGGEGGVGVEALLAAAENGGVAGLQAKDGAVDGDVGAGLIDDADDADGHADFADVQAVGAGRFFQQIADGIGERDDLADGDGEMVEARGRESESVAGGGGESGGFGGGEVLGVGGEERGVGGVDQVGEAGEGGIFGGGRDGREHEGRGAGALGEGRDEAREFG